MATSYGNNGGTGARETEIRVTTNLVASGADIGGLGHAYTQGELAVLVDGITGSGGRSPANTPNNSGDKWIRFDWGPGAEGGIVIDEFKLYLSGTDGQFDDSVWTWEGSDDASSWTTIGTSFNLGVNATETIARTNSTGYRYYRIHTTSFNGPGGTYALREFEFKIEDITPQADRPSVFNTGGRGDRTASISVTTTASLGVGTINNLVDGAQGVNSSDAMAFTSGQSSKEIVFDFGSGAEGNIVIDSFAWYVDGTNNHGTWKLQGSDNGSSYTDVTSTFTLGGDSTGRNYYGYVGNTTGYRYYRLLQTAGTTTTMTNLEIEFRLYDLGGGGPGPGSGRKPIVIVIGG